MRSRQARRIGAALVFAVFALLLSPAAPAWAEKLIIFKNGKVMRAKDVKVDKGWTLAELSKGGTVGVRTTDVVRVEDAAGESGGAESTPNMASTEGRGAGREGGGGPVRTDESEAEISSTIQERIEQRQQELQEKQAQETEAAPTAVTAPGMRPLQNLNQPAAGRGFRRSRNVANPAPGSRAQTGIRELQPREDAQVPDEDNDDE